MVSDATIGAEQTSDAMQFIADDRDLRSVNPGARVVADPRAAAESVLHETRDRIRVVLERRPERPTVLLSGGVDSILVAAVAAELGAEPHAVTVVTDGETDRPNAEAAARALGLTHEIVELSSDDVVRLAADAIHRLGTVELWEVTAAIPLLAVRDAVTPGAILTGSGADAIFAGGRKLTEPADSPAAVAEMDRLIRTESASNFTVDRLIPHFYAALLEDREDDLIHVFQTARFWDLAATFGPTAFFAEHAGVPFDKVCVRMACAELLGPAAAEIAWAPKAPIQRSTGIMGSLANSARRRAAALPGALTYGDPMREPMEAVATRLYLAALGDDRSDRD